MSESRRTLLALLEQDTELRQIVPLIRIIFEAPDRSLGSFVALANLWTRLKIRRRALLVLWLKDDLAIKDDLPVKEIACFVGVHHRTLYKDEEFMGARERALAERMGNLPRGHRPDAEGEGDFDAWE